jgi:uncharacterized spore protein YtfJ
MEVMMASTPAPFEPIAAIIERSLNIKHVYGEPIQRGDTTVIPVAQVMYGFGAGGGEGRRRRRNETSSDDPGGPEGQGSGGGGGLRMTPAGALEVGPGGTRFVPFLQIQPLLGAAAVGLLLGWLIARRK